MTLIPHDGQREQAAILAYFIKRVIESCEKSTIYEVKKWSGDAGGADSIPKLAKSVQDRIKNEKDLFKNDPQLVKLLDNTITNALVKLTDVDAAGRSDAVVFENMKILINEMNEMYSPLDVMLKMKPKENKLPYDEKLLREVVADLKAIVAKSKLDNGFTRAIAVIPDPDKTPPDELFDALTAAIKNKSGKPGKIQARMSGSLVTAYEIKMGKERRILLEIDKHVKQWGKIQIRQTKHGAAVHSAPLQRGSAI